MVGQVYTCDATRDGIDDEEGDGFTVNIGRSGAISENGTVIDLGNNNIISNGGSLESDTRRGIRVVDGNTITNNGSIDVKTVGIEANDENTIVNGAAAKILTDGKDGRGIFVDDRNEVINSGLIETERDEGVEADDDNRITNEVNGFIRVEDRHGIFIGDRNIVLNKGLIEVDDNGIEADGDGNENTISISATGVIIAGDAGVMISGGDGNNIDVAGTIRSEEYGIEVDGGGDDNTITITSSGSVDSEGLGIRFGEGFGSKDNVIINNGSINSMNDGIGGGGERLTIRNNGTIESSDQRAVDVFVDETYLFNNVRLISGKDETVRLGSGDDTFTWQAYSFVSGDVDMGDGDDRLVVEAAEVFGSTFFEGLETAEVADGVFAILEEVGSGEFNLHTGSATILGASGALTGSLASDFAGQALSSGASTSAAGQVSRGNGTSDVWWVSAGGATKADTGNGSSQGSQNLTFGRTIGEYEVFFGYSQASADITGTTDSVDQTTFYLGASSSLQINEDLVLKGTAVLGRANADYALSLGPTSASSTFGTAAGRLNFTRNGYVMGAYAGYSRSSLTDLTVGSITFASDDSSSVFGGVDVRTATYVTNNGLELNAVLGLGFQNGKGGTVTMTTGGTSESFLGADTEQQFGLLGVDFAAGWLSGGLAVRAPSGGSAQTSLWVRTEF